VELRARRVALIAVSPRPDPASPDFVLCNYGVRRIQAALLADPALADMEVRLFEAEDRDADRLAAHVAAFDPDLVGGSAYLWSLPTLMGALRRLARPDRRIVLGGPSARPEMFARPPFDDAPTLVDALVLGQGEAAIRAIAGGAPLPTVPGLALPDGAGWRQTADAAAGARIEDIASPYQLGLVPPGGYATLQSYFGCPLSCAYCAWGAMGNARDVLGVDHLAAELRAFQAGGYEGAILVDAALNLNPNAFRNLAEAEAEVGFFRDATLLCEVYPSRLTDAHLAFLQGISRPQVSVGLQSYDPDVLARLQRPFDADRFEARVREVAGIADVIVEIILGLPGDDPASFRRTFERLMTLPAGIRVYPCLALPDALMRDAPADFALRWDPVSLKLTSAWGWTAADLAETTAWMNQMAADNDGNAGEWWWSFDRFEVRNAAQRATQRSTPPVSSTGPAGPPAASPRRPRPVPPTLAARLRGAVQAGSQGRWTAAHITREGDRVLVQVEGEGAGFQLWMVRQAADAPSYRTFGRLAFGYNGPAPEPLSALDRVLAHMVAP
jgi:radical SAM superfamily enzyme YgiQ (UPF0313 family)